MSDSGLLGHELDMVNFNNKVFYLRANTANGTSNAETVFHYKQHENVVTAEFSGGAVVCGRIIALHKGDRLDMVYQMLTVANELKSGRAIAKITLTENDKIQLDLDWEWLTGSDVKGISSYAER